MKKERKKAKPEGRRKNDDHDGQNGEKVRRKKILFWKVWQAENFFLFIHVTPHKKKKKTSTKKQKNKKKKKKKEKMKK